MKKKFAILGASALLLFGATGCSTKLQKAQQLLDENVVNVLNSNDMVDKVTDVDFDKYAFLAADFTPNDYYYTIDINGLASYNNNSNQAYVSLQYEVEKSVFKEIDKNKSDKVINSLAQIVNNYEMKDVSFTPMTSVNTFNKCMGKVFDSPVEGFRHSSNLTYKVNDIEYNHENGYVSFNTMSNTKYSKTVSEPQYVVIGVDSNGHPRMGWRLVPKTYYEKFNQEYQIFIKSSPEELKEMENDPSKIFDKFVEMVNEKNNEDIVVRSVSINTDKEFNDGADYSM